jgi:superfamily I DNA and/or RNA helicase
VVPVVSTTFASLDRLFTGLGRESLGWLFVDEAGQAAPQYAAGGLWRARRAVIVGDPLQIQPVVTLPWGGQRALAREYGVGEQWAPSRTSVQQLADRIAEHGTSLPSPVAGEPVWVGTPLRVHRRCDRPMFDISNAIAYHGLMVFGTKVRDPFHGCDGWQDITSAIAEGHWIPAEGEALCTLLTHLRDAGLPAADIRVISPFRKVAAHAYRVHESVFPDVSGKHRAQWVGTVHTMQGKEADVVILVLGGDPARAGARHFATKAPNLLNVAVTRARRRLYIIGNREAWAAAPYFDVLSATLP